MTPNCVCRLHTIIKKCATVVLLRLPFLSFWREVEVSNFGNMKTNTHTCTVAGNRIFRCATLLLALAALCGVAPLPPPSRSHTPRQTHQSPKQLTCAVPCTSQVRRLARADKANGNELPPLRSVTMGSRQSLIETASVADDVKWGAVSLDSLQYSSVVSAKVGELAGAGCLSSTALHRVNVQDSAVDAFQRSNQLQRWLSLRSVLLSAQPATDEECVQVQRRLRAWMDAEVEMVENVVGKDASAFNALLAQRQVVLERIFLARRRLLARKSSNSTDVVPTTLFSDGGIDCGVAGMMLATLRMQLLTMSTNPALVPQVAAMVETTLPALRSGGGPLAAVVAEGSHALTAWFADAVDRSSDVGLDAAGISACVAAMTRTAVASKSLHAMLDVVKVLLVALRDGPGSELLASSGGIASKSLPTALAELCDHQGNFDLSLPTTLARSESCPAPLIQDTTQHSSVASDGPFLYLLNAGGLFKVGTGRDSIFGRVYASVDGFCSNEAAVLACVGDLLFVRTASAAPAPWKVLRTSDLAELSGSAMPVANISPVGSTEPVFCSEGRYLYVAEQDAADAGGNAVIRVLDPYVLGPRRAMQVVRTIGPLPPSMAAVLFASEPRRLYTNGQRLVVWSASHAWRWNLDSLELEAGEEPLALGPLAKSDSGIASASSTYDAVNNVVWVFAPTVAQQTLSVFATSGTAPSVAAVPSSKKARSTDPDAAWEPEAILAEVQTRHEEQRVDVPLGAPGAGLQPIALALQLLAHLDRLGGAEATGMLGFVPTGDSVKLEEPFVVQATPATFKTLAYLLEAETTVGLASRTRQSLYCLLALVRVLSANLERYARVAPGGGGSSEAEDASLKETFESLFTSIMNIVRCPVDEEDPIGAVPVLHRAAWTAFSIGLDVFAQHGVSQGALVLDVLTGEDSSPESVHILFSHLAKRSDVAEIIVPASPPAGMSLDEHTRQNLDVITALLNTVEQDLPARHSDTGVLVPSPVLTVLKEVQTGLLVRAMHQALGGDSSLSDSGDAVAPGFSGAASAAPDADYSSLTSLTTAVIERAAHSLEGIIEATPAEPTDAEKQQVREAVEVSVVGCLVPSMALSTITMLPHLPTSVAEALLPPFTDLLALVDKLAARVGPDNTYAEAACAERVAQPVNHLIGTKVVESNHPYQCNQDVTTEVALKGADEYELVFDPQCFSEAGLDYLEVTGGPAPQKFSGTAFRNEGSVRIKAPRLKLLWHTDAAGVEWGYKVTIRGFRRLELVQAAPITWMEDLLRLVGRVVALGVRMLIVGERLTKEEGAESTMRWLTSPLLRNALETAPDSGSSSVGASTPRGSPTAAGGLLNAAIAAASPHVVTRSDKSDFLRDMRKGAKGSDGAKFFALLDKADRSLKTGGKWTTRAHRAVFAALLKHNGLLAESISFSKIPGAKAAMVPRAIRAAFTASRTVRDHMVQRHQVSRLGYKELALDVLEKCRFLLRFNPFVESPALLALGDAAAAASMPAGPPGALNRASSADAPVPPPPPPSGWGKLRRQLSEGSSAGHRQVVGRVVVNSWRKRQRQLETGGDGVLTDTPNDSVLSFVKSPVPIAELNRVLQRREQRVDHRRVGVTTATAVLQRGLTADHVAMDIVKGIAYGLEDIARTQRQALGSSRRTGVAALHGDANGSDSEEEAEDAQEAKAGETELGYFLINLEACSPELVQRAREAFYGLFAHLLAMLDATMGRSSNHGVMIQLLALRMLSTPFRKEDTKFLVKSNVFATLARLVEAAEPDADGAGGEGADARVEEDGAQSAESAAAAAAGEAESKGGEGEGAGADTDTDSKREPGAEADGKEGETAGPTLPAELAGFGFQPAANAMVSDDLVVAHVGEDSRPESVACLLANFRCVVLVWVFGWGCVRVCVSRCVCHGVCVTVCVCTGLCFVVL